MIYIIGSLRNPEILALTNRLTREGHEVFSDWKCASENADDAWRDYEQGRGRSFTEALSGYAAQHVFAFDRTHLLRADTVVLAQPCGKSGHLELGWALGQGKKGYILLDGEPERWDVMYAFATKVVNNVEDLVEELDEDRNVQRLRAEGYSLIYDENGKMFDKSAMDYLRQVDESWAENE